MPIYEYQCKACGRRFEEYTSRASAAVDTSCPACQARDVERCISRPADLTVRGGPPAGRACGPVG
jgi:putative FmdB family regulatory protein